MRLSFLQMGSHLLLAMSVPSLSVDRVTNTKEGKGIKLVLSVKPDTSASKVIRVSVDFLLSLIQHFAILWLNLRGFLFQGVQGSMEMRMKMNSMTWSMNSTTMATILSIILKDLSMAVVIFIVLARESLISRTWITLLPTRKFLSLRMVKR